MITLRQGAFKLAAFLAQIPFIAHEHTERHGIGIAIFRRMDERMGGIK